MFCPSCKNQIPDGSCVCPACGLQLQQGNTEVLQTPTYQQEPYQQAPYQQVPNQQAPYQQAPYQQTPYQQTPYQQAPYQQAPYQQAPYQQAPYQQAPYQQNPYEQPAVQPVQKTEAAKTTAFDKLAGKLVYATFLLSLLLLAASVLITLTTDLMRIPMIKTVLQIAEAEGDIAEARMELNNILSEGRDEMTDYSDEMTDVEEKAIDDILSSAEKLSRNFSVMNIRSFFKTLESSAEILDENSLNFALGANSTDFFTGIREINIAINVIIVIVVCAFLLPLLFTILGGLLKNRGLTITALVFTVISQLALCGIIWVILSLAIYIFQVILCTKAKRYKTLTAAE